MKNLYLVRHAKSSWKLPVDDHKRPLKKRGVSDAILISDHIKDLVSKPDVLLTSDAERAKATALYFKKAFNLESDSLFINKSLTLTSILLFIFLLRFLCWFNLFRHTL